jgi:MAF protein
MRIIGGFHSESSKAPENMKRIVLASTSPYRKALLTRLALPFETSRPDCDESPKDGELPTELVRRLALDKARSVASKHPGTVIIGSDQVAELDGRILGKPGTHDNAVAQLSRASGRQVIFHTGLCLLDADSGNFQLDCVPFGVTFRNLNTIQIERYLFQEKPYDCAGSFRSEGYGITLFKRLEGDDPSSLIGLPLIRLVEMLGGAGVYLP